MMNRLFLRASLVGSLGLMVGCSSIFGPEGFFRNRGHDYLKADVIEPMKVPSQIETTHVESLYAIPSVSEDEMLYSDTFEVPRPLAMADASLDEQVKIQSLNQQRWILVNASPAEVWPQVRSFLAGNNLNVIYTNASEGLMETSWLKFQDNESTKDKYRIKIDAGIQPQTTEVHVLHMSMPWDTPGSGQVNWPSQSISAEREMWMVDELASVLASAASQGQSASLLAQNIGVSDRVKLTTEQGEPVLNLSLDYSRAWATVSHSLESEGFVHWEDDKEVGIFYVNYLESDEEDAVDYAEGKTRGLMGGLFDFSKTMGKKPEPEKVEEEEKPAKPAAPYVLSDVLANLKPEDNELNRKIFSSVTADAQTLSNIPGYLIVVRGWDGEVEVRIRDAHARNIDPVKAKKLLKQIRLNLI